jgi:hypothetical protein
MSSTRKTLEHPDSAKSLPEVAEAAEAAAVAEAAEAAAEAAEAAEAAAAAAAVAAVCRGEFAASARAEHFPITLTDAGHHGRVDQVRPGHARVVSSASVTSALTRERVHACP